MKAYIELIKSRLMGRWQQLSLRERRMLMIAAPILLIALLYVAIWLPYRTTRQSLDAQLPTLSAELIQMREQAKQAKELQTANRVNPVAPDKLLSAIEDSLTAVALNGYVTKLENLGDARVQLVASKMPFKKWVYWLERLSKEIGVAVVVAKIQSEGEGAVSIEATLAPLGAQVQDA